MVVRIISVLGVVGIANGEGTWGARDILSFDQPCGYTDTAIVFCDMKTNHHQLKWVKTTHRYFLSVSMDQKSGHSSDGSLALSCNQGVAGLCCDLEAWVGKNLLPSSFKLLAELTSVQQYDGQPPFCMAIGWRMPAPTQVLEVAHSSLPHGPLQRGHFASPSQQWVSVRMGSLYNKISYHSCHIPLVGWKSQILSVAGEWLT